MSDHFDEVEHRKQRLEIACALYAENNEKQRYTIKGALREADNIMEANRLMLVPVPYGDPLRVDEADAMRYRWLRRHFTRLVVKIDWDIRPRMQDGKMTVRYICIANNEHETDVQSVDDAVDVAMKGIP